MGNHTTIAVTKERHAQLKALAAHTGTSIATILDKLITQGLAAAGLPDTLPGLEVVKLSPSKIHLSADGLPIVHLTPGAARTLADAMDFVAAQNGRRKCVTPKKDIVEVSRTGSAVTISVLCGTTGATGSRSFATGLAHDLAGQLRRAAGN